MIRRHFLKSLAALCTLAWVLPGKTQAIQTSVHQELPDDLETAIRALRPNLKRFAIVRSFHISANGKTQHITEISLELIGRAGIPELLVNPPLRDGYRRVEITLTTDPFEIDADGLQMYLKAESRIVDEEV